ncbi:MAG: SDR family NAD(P)-dependent oxidoreductase [Sulfuricurvum sp.]|nr:SDR family NAD(P)-dependent oxidoreductase [Sulfuricurvum sp.]
MELPMKWLSVTKGIVQISDPSGFQEHRFGLPYQSRWETLKGKVFLVTGAGTGYGRAISVSLAAAGAYVYIVGRRIEKLSESVSEASQYNINTENIYSISADMSVESDIQSVIAVIAQRSGKLDGVVGCSAISPEHQNGFEHSTIDQWNTIMSVNVQSHWLILKEAFPLMQTSGFAKSIWFSSGAGWAFTPGIGLYNLSKATLNAACGSMAAEYAQNHPTIDIQFNILDPWEAKTEMNTESPYSPYTACAMTLALLSHGEDGPNGRYFHRDGRHLEFLEADPYEKSLFARELC